MFQKQRTDPRSAIAAVEHFAGWQKYTAWQQVKLPRKPSEPAPSCFRRYSDMSDHPALIPPQEQLQVSSQVITPCANLEFLTSDCNGVQITSPRLMVFTVLQSAKKILCAGHDC